MILMIRVMGSMIEIEIMPKSKKLVLRLSWDARGVVSGVVISKIYFYCNDGL
jgi:hypothetical protein